MGLLRFILALSVLADHINAPCRFLHFSGSQSAVEGFFVISGYLIFLILDKSYDQKRNFYANRMLRIYPLYILVLSSYLAFDLYRTGGFHLTIILLITNIIILGLDMVVLANMGHPTPLGHSLVLVQSWSLSLELYFYLMAPFFRKKKTLVLFLTLGILSLKGFLFLFASIPDPFSYRFFPLELGFFLLGGCSYYFIKVKNMSLALLGIIISVSWSLFGQGRVIGPNNAASLVFPLIIAITIPSMADWDRKAFIRRIGTYSYPIFLVHILVNVLLSRIFKVIGVSVNSIFNYVLVVTFCLLISMALVRFVETPLETTRLKLRKNQS